MRALATKLSRLQVSSTTRPNTFKKTLNLLLVSYLFRSLGTVVGISVVSTATQETLRRQLYSRLSGNSDVEDVHFKPPI